MFAFQFTIVEKILDEPVQIFTSIFLNFSF